MSGEMPASSTTSDRHSSRISDSSTASPVASSRVRASRSRMEEAVEPIAVMVAPTRGVTQPTVYGASTSSAS